MLRLWAIYHGKKAYYHFYKNYPDADSSTDTIKIFLTFIYVFWEKVPEKLKDKKIIEKEKKNKLCYGRQY